MRIVCLDETTAPVLDPGRGKVKKGFFWGVPKTRFTAASALRVDSIVLRAHFRRDELVGSYGLVEPLLMSK